MIIVTLYLYQISEDPLVFPKTLPEGTTVTGTIRDQSVDLMQPSIIMQGAPSTAFNYCYIPDFGRYYFVEPPISERTGLIRLQMRCDVLQSFADQIIAAPVIVERSAEKYNTYIADPERVFYQDRLNQYISIGDLGDPSAIIMVTVG